MPYYFKTDFLDKLVITMDNWQFCGNYYLFH
jgi:hypothetical protein